MTDRLYPTHTDRPYRQYRRVDEYVGFSPKVFDYASEYFKTLSSEHGTELKSEFYIPLIVNTLIGERSLKVSVLETDSEWYGVTYKEDKPGIVRGCCGKCLRLVIILPISGGKDGYEEIADYRRCRIYSVSYQY